MSRVNDSVAGPTESPESDLPDAAEPEATPAGAWAPIVAAVVPAVFGLAAIFGGYDLGLGMLTEPGSGMWPFIVGVLLVVASVALLVLRPAEGTPEAFTRGAWAVVLGIATLVGYSVAFPLVGFEIPTAVLIAVWLKLIGRESWVTTAAVSVGATVVLYLLFVLGLGVAIPHLVSF